VYLLSQDEKNPPASTWVEAGGLLLQTDNGIGKPYSHCSIAAVLLAGQHPAVTITPGCPE
jgi:hypothetical protein